MSEVLQRSRDAIVAPVAILASDPHDQVRDLSVDSRSSRVNAVLGTVKLLGDQLAVPTQDRFRFRDQRKVVQRLTSESFAMAASVARCGLVNRSRAGKCERRIRFSAIRYSFCSRSCWFTIPVTYANSRATCVFFIQTHHHIPLVFSMHSNCLTIRPEALRRALTCCGTSMPYSLRGPRIWLHSCVVAPSDGCEPGEYIERTFALNCVSRTFSEACFSLAH